MALAQTRDGGRRHRGRRRGVRGWVVALVGALAVAVLPTPAVALAGTASISGTVTDAAGEPLMSIYVVAWDAALDVSGTAMTAADGTYTIGGLEPGTYQVRFMTYYRAFQYVGEYYPDAYQEEDATSVTLAADDAVAGFDAALASAASISGFAYDPWGGPASSVSVSLTNLDGVNGLLHGTVNFGDDGSFAFVGVPAGTYTLRFGGPGYVTEYYDDAATIEAATPIIVAAGESVGELEVTLAWSGGISGTVVDEAGAPMAGVVVWAEGSGGSYTTDTDGSGEYTLPLPVGEYLVSFMSASTNPVYLEYDLTEPVTVIADEYTTGIDAQMVVDFVVPTFTDVAPGQVFADDIAWLAANGISTGWPDGTFRPAAPVTREAMTAFMYRFATRVFAFLRISVSFTDVTEGNPFYDDIRWAAETGLATGWPDGTFRPSLAIERQAMAAFLYRFAGPGDYTPPAVSPFVDVQPGDAFYTEICWLAERGIATGTVTASGAWFKPAEPVERQAMAAFLHRMAEPTRS